MIYEGLVAKRAEREAKEQDKAKGKRNSGPKRKSPEEVGALEPKAKAARMSQAEEDEILPGPWRAPLAWTWYNGGCGQ
ncbi:MAG: hypothetical protein HETSPECPRED_009823 [Heterodermia speciosa]|uniref:Uncharacterized protein n=1 Tax=Heterodermia speciosa TaxID=116794 RepID=A0A8H3IPI5_9LECA|nr:MAG: hypothetical protein HETSPECPRED_009823 [Heterodermia speciosa]